MYGLLVILGLLLIISQCANNERIAAQKIEGMANQNSENSNATPTKAELPSVKKPSGLRNVVAFHLGDDLYANANAPYGFDIPISMQEEFMLLKDLGLTKDSALSSKSSK